MPATDSLAPRHLFPPGFCPEIAGLCRQGGRFLRGPRLQFDDIAFGIGDVTPGHFRAGGNFQGHDLADGSTAPLENRFSCVRHVRHGKRDRSQARTIHRGRAALWPRVVTEHPQRGASLSVTGQARMDATQTSARNTRTGLQWFAPKVAFRRDGDATHEFCWSKSLSARQPSAMRLGWTYLASITVRSLPGCLGPRLSYPRTIPWASSR